MTVSLKWLLDGIAAVPDSDAQIVDLAIDSRDVRAGSLFLALRGTKTHGLEHAADAAARGQAGLAEFLHERGQVQETHVPLAPEPGMVVQHVGEVRHGHRLDKDPHTRILLSGRVPVQPRGPRVLAQLRAAAPGAGRYTPGAAGGRQV